MVDQTENHETAKEDAKTKEKAEAKEETQQDLNELKLSLIPDIAKKLYEDFVQKHTEEELKKEGITLQNISDQLASEMNPQDSTGGGFMSWISRGQSMSGWVNKIKHIWEKPSIESFRGLFSESTKDKIDEVVKITLEKLKAIKDTVELHAYLKNIGIKKNDDSKQDQKKQEGQKNKESEKSEEDQKKQEGEKSEEEQKKEPKKGEKDKSDQENEEDKGKGKEKGEKKEEKSEEGEKKEKKDEKSNVERSADEEGESGDGPDEELSVKEN